MTIETTMTREQLASRVLTSSAKLLLLAFTTESLRKPTIEETGRALGLATRTTYRAFAELRELGLVQFETQIVGVSFKKRRVAVATA